MQVVGWLGLGMELGCLREECRPPNGAPERMVLMRAWLPSITSSTTFTARIVAKCFDPLADRHDASSAAYGSIGQVVTRQRSLLSAFKTTASK
jgi:hypothetical protein